MRRMGMLNVNGEVGSPWSGSAHAASCEKVNVYLVSYSMLSVVATVAVQYR